MKIHRIWKQIVILVLLLSYFQSTANQLNSNNESAMKIPDTLQNRKPAVAGQFYPSDPAELMQMLKKLFTSVQTPETYNKILAIISPHAGYVFSGEVAAEAFKCIDPGKTYNTVFIIGNSHRNSFPGASVYSVGNYITPLGLVETDFDVAEKIVKENSILSFDPNFQRSEHSIEVQLPFLQYHFKNKFKIVPILLGSQDETICKKIAAALKPYFSEENLFVVSTDFSHYPAYNEAIRTDKMMADAIISNEPEKFLKAVQSCSEAKTSNLSTGCCSWPSVITLMYLTENITGMVYNPLVYKNSGDSEYGEKDRVVGYWALSVYNAKPEDSFISESDKKVLLKLARTTIHDYLSESYISDKSLNSISASLTKKAGVFVTLKKNGELRGCIGNFEGENSLFETVQKMAIASATQDYRFQQVTLDEIKSIDIEISILTPMTKITDVNKIRLGIDGIYIRKGGRSGTFLPQVAVETGWDLNEFLGHCARDKAGIGWDGWKDRDAEIFIYQAIVFGEKD